jgi:hypothetical protein
MDPFCSNFSTKEVFMGSQSKRKNGKPVGKKRKPTAKDWMNQKFYPTSSFGFSISKPWLPLLNKYNMPSVRYDD